MHPVYEFKRLSRKHISNVIASLEREAEAIEQKLEHLASLNQGSAHVMMESGFDHELTQILEAIMCLREYENSRID